MKKVVKGFASIVMFASMIFVVGCKPPTSTSDPSTGGSEPKITITVEHDDNIENVEPATLSVAKGSKWSAFKSKINVTPKTGFVHAGWKVNDASGADLTDNYPFEKDTTVFAVSKEKAKEQVTITVKGDDGIELASENTFTVDKNAKWGDIKNEAKAKITVKANYRFVEWRAHDKLGEVLTDDKRFTENTTVFAVSKETVTITVKGDDGIEIPAENTFTVDKNAKWGDIKDLAKAKIKEKANYEFVEWHLNDKRGAVLENYIFFTKNTTVFAVSKETITITVQGDDGIEIPAENTFTVDKNTIWGNIKDLAKDKIKEKANYRFVEWRLNSGSGEVLTYNKRFEQNTTVFAVSKETITITVHGDERIEREQAFKIPSGSAWSSIKAEIKGKIKPRAAWEKDWNNRDYAVYEWRFDDENGEKISDTHTFTDNATVYAVSNYINWDINNWELVGYRGSEPRGKVIISDNDVGSIGDSVFKGCSSLTTINIPNVKSIGDSAFEGCSSLTTINIPDNDNVRSIGDSAFKGCLSLTTINIPSNVTSIRNSTFEGCSLLTTINIPDNDNVRSIGDSAFEGCSLLTTINIPKDVTKIGRKAFYDCSGLASVTFADPKGWATYTDNYTIKEDDIDKSQLKDKSTAATLLRETYCSKYWKKN